jgi:hypothetical protein
MQTDNTTKFLGANSGEAGQSTHVKDYAISPRLNLQGKTLVELKFDYSMKRWLQAEKLFLVYRRTPTEAWQSWLELPTSGVGAGFRWKTYSVQLPAEALSGSTQVALLYDDGRSLGYGAAIDNVQVVEILSGIDQAANQTSVELFPNPSQGMVFLRLHSDRPLTIRLIDHAGRSLITKHFENPYNLTEPLDLMTYPDGTYFVLIETADEVIVRQLIKTR